MSIKVGDRVAFSRAESAISGHACAAWGIDYINSLEFNNCKFHKGTVTKIKTHAFFFFKLKKPVYLVDDYYIMTNLKPIVTRHAILRKVINKGTELESVWEFELTP